MPLLNSLGANGDAPATRRLPRRRNLVRNALREVEQFFPREQWMTVVVQGDQTVRVTLWGGEHSRAYEQPAGAASTSTTIPQPTARSAPTAREISRNNRARLHQLSQGFYSKQLLRRAFRAIARARDASGDVSSSPARAEGVPPSAPQVPSAAGLSESANSGVLDGALPAAGASPGSKRAAPPSCVASSSPPHSRLAQRARGDGPDVGSGETAMMNVCASPFIMPPPTPFGADFVPLLPPHPPPPIPSPEHAASFYARMEKARMRQQTGAMKHAAPPLPLGAVVNPKSAPLPPAEKPNSGWAAACPPSTVPLVLTTGACQFGHGVGGFTTNSIHLRSKISALHCALHDGRPVFFWC